YMSPEQASGRAGDVGPLADVYAVGAILYECLTGRPPFQGATPVDTLLQVTTVDPVPVRQLQPAVPRDLETICHCCLAKQPARRYGGARERVEEVRRSRGGRPIKARPVSFPTRTWRWCRRNPALGGLIATLAVGFGATFSFWWQATASEREAVEGRRQ